MLFIMIEPIQLGSVCDCFSTEQRYVLMKCVTQLFFDVLMRVFRTSDYCYFVGDYGEGGKEKCWSKRFLKQYQSVSFEMQNEHTE